MNRQAIVKNRDTISATVLMENHIVIQITNPNRDWDGEYGTFLFPTLPEACAEFRKGVLQLRFDDIDEPTEPYTMFTDEQADQILDFVFTEHKGITWILVHCEAGYSRSPAVAAAITKISGGDDSPYFRMFSPNSLVYSKLISRAFERGLHDGKSARL